MQSCAALQPPQQLAFAAEGGRHLLEHAPQTRRGAGASASQSASSSTALAHAHAAQFAPVTRARQQASASGAEMLPTSLPRRRIRTRRGVRVRMCERGGVAPASVRGAGTRAADSGALDAGAGDWRGRLKASPRGLREGRHSRNRAHGREPRSPGELQLCATNCSDSSAQHGAAIRLALPAASRNRGIAHRIATVA